MPTISPELFPSDGLRSLSPKEALQRAKALNCTVEKSSKPVCSGQMNVGLFFDGTGNNMDADFISKAPEIRKHSNIVRLFNVYPENSSEGNFRFYIPGVGTPFAEIGDKGSRLGGPFAWNGESRITWALTRLINAPHIYATNSPLIDDKLAGVIANNMASMFTPQALRRNILSNWQGKLRDALVGKRPVIEQINLSVFGFSRGAAEARAFCNWLFEVCEEKMADGYLLGFR